MSPKQNNQFADALGDIFDVFIPPTHDSTKWKNWLNTPHVFGLSRLQRISRYDFSNIFKTEAGTTDTSQV